MEKGFNFIKLFRLRVNDSLLSLDINSAMFCFGLQTGLRDDSLRKEITSIGPYLKELNGLWDIQNLRKIQNGSDDTTESIDVPYGVVLTIHQLLYTTNTNKPLWGMFYLFGHSIGLLNSNIIRSDEFQYIINLFPQSFLNQHSKTIESLSHDFIIENFDIEISNKSEKAYAILVNSVKNKV
jgi:hypothetical protein